MEFRKIEPPPHLADYQRGSCTLEAPKNCDIGKLTKMSVKLPVFVC